jgi:hypothetical protein
MQIGVDLDNTIIRYDALFHAAAVERNLIPPQVPQNKSAVKAEIIRHHGARRWTLLQAHVYGPLLERAEPFPGVVDFFLRCRSEGVGICILSHKSRLPALGVPHDLRAAALRWLETHGWFAHDGIGLSVADVEFHGERTEKVRAVARRACDLFIDDLPDVFTEPGFPRTTAALLFDPPGIHAEHNRWRRVCSWAEIEATAFAVIAA